jgi:hypothetical protein
VYYYSFDAMIRYVKSNVVICRNVLLNYNTMNNWIIVLFFVVWSLSLVCFVLGSIYKAKYEAILKKQSELKIDNSLILSGVWAILLGNTTEAFDKSIHQQFSKNMTKLEDLHDEGRKMKKLEYAFFITGVVIFNLSWIAAFFMK